MGTRADFYVGRGTEAEWLGSIAFDGYPVGVFDGSFQPTNFSTAEGWREGVAGLLSSRDDSTVPEQGWPWPWKDSGTTDYAYAWEGGKVYGSSFGHAWFVVDPDVEGFGEPSEDDEDDAAVGADAVFPDMTDRQNVTFGHRSGAMFFGGGA